MDVAGCGVVLVVIGIIAALFVFLPWPIALIIIIGLGLISAGYSR